MRPLVVFAVPTMSDIPKIDRSASRYVPLVTLSGLALFLFVLLFRGSGFPPRRHGAVKAHPAEAARLPDPAALRTLEARLRAASAADPSKRDPHWALANFYEEEGRIPQASAQLDLITRLGPDGPGERLALANLRLVLQQFRQAEVMYRIVTRLQPRSNQAWQGLATALYAQHRYFEARQAAQQAVLLRPDDLSSRFLLASTTLEYSAEFGNFAAQHRELAEARRDFQKLATAMPSNADVYARLGRACLMLQDWNGAVAALRRALTLSSQPGSFLLLAKAEKGASDTAAAQDVLAQGLARYPNDAALHDVRGQQLQALADGTPDQALAEFQKAIALQPKNEKFLEHEGVALIQVGHLPEARDAFVTAIGLAPDRAFPYQQLAVVYTRLGDVAKARTADRAASAVVFNTQQLHQIQDLSALHPGSVPLRLILADRYHDLGMAGAARDQYLQAVRLDPKNARARKALAGLNETGR